MKQRTTLYEFAPLILVTLMGLALRAAYLSMDLLGWDEIIIYEWCRDMSFWQIMTFYENIGNHIFQTLVAKASMMLFSPTIEGARFPDLVIGTALIPVSYFFARDVLRMRYPIILATLIAGTSWELFYSVNARGYEFQAFFVVLQLLLTQKMLENPRSGKLRAGWFVTWILHFYTLPTAVWFLVPLSLFTFVEWWRISPRTFGLWPFFKNQFVSYFVIGIIVGGLYALAVLNPDGKEEVAMFYPGNVDYTANYHLTIDYLFTRLPENLTWDFTLTGRSVYWRLLQIGLVAALFLRPAFFLYMISLAGVLIVFNIPLKTPLPIRVYGFMSPLGLALCSMTIDCALRLLFWPLPRLFAKPIFPAALAAAAILFMEQTRQNLNEFELMNPEKLVGARLFVEYMGRPENRDKQMLFIYPQYRYWSERLNIPLVSAQAQLLPEVLTTVRYRREGVDEMMARVTGKHGEEVLSQYDIGLEKIERFIDVDVYRLKFTKKNPPA